MYTIEQMKLAYEAGRSFELTRKDNFQELIDKLDKTNELNTCASCNQEVETHQLCIKCVTKMIENDY